MGSAAIAGDHDVLRAEPDTGTSHGRYVWEGLATRFLAEHPTSESREPRHLGASTEEQQQQLGTGSSDPYTSAAPAGTASAASIPPPPSYPPPPPHLPVPAPHASPTPQRALRPKWKKARWFKRDHAAPATHADNREGEGNDHEGKTRDTSGASPAADNNDVHDAVERTNSDEYVNISLNDLPATTAYTSE